MRIRDIAFPAVLLASFLFLPGGRHSYATAAPPGSTVDSAISGLADKLVRSLSGAGAKRIVVLDFRGPQGESHPVGKWLADQLSLALQNNATGLEVIARSEIRDEQGEDKNETKRVFPGEKDIEAWRSYGADAITSGTYAKTSQQLSVTLDMRFLGPTQQHVPSIRGAVPISEEITSLSVDPIPPFKGDVPYAGVAGVTVPSCIYCPQPQYTREALKAKYQGLVLLGMVVTTEGKVEKATVISGKAYRLEEKALNALKDWKFKPAEDLDGEPVATKIQVEITFHFH